MQAQAMGFPAGSGLLMLTAQAKAANMLFRGGEYSEPAPDSAEGKEILKVWRALTRDLTDIVLVGMPSSGKNTLGEIVAEKLSRPFFDTDALIVSRTGKDIPTIFRERGEEGFREEERAVVAECAAKTGAVIATGGGAPLSEENRLNLKSNGFVVFCDRDTDKLETAGRPLSRDRETLVKMREARLPVYTAFADAEVCNDGAPEECAEKITEKFDENFGH